ncbi:PaaI family thioesterase [Sneathiella chinensis]|uniref:Aromatic compound catabolic protein n=1 Tax=Sneathiella chinensis TaxID=349750 RepID=A0ABQ5U6B6_9PROT|nr:PaaI family thioesterase [Sneathiella chinensis]GLQ06026.1 aromatic compound catabolic protein [Sneathiella chinensis]
MTKTVSKPNINQLYANLNGLEQMQMAFQHKGNRPSIGETLDFDLVSVEKGVAVFEGNPSEKHMNPIGSIHGGYAATLLDSALGCSIHTMLEAGESYTTVDLNVKYIRAMKPGMGKVTCRGEVVHKGRKIATAEARLVGEDGKIYAHGNTTCVIL